MNTVTISGARDLNRRLEALKRNGDLLRDLQLETVAEAKRRVPRKTSFLGRSIHPGAVSNDAAIIEATAPYAAYVEFGTKPHTIKPRAKRALAWPATAAGARLSGRARTSTRRGGLGGMRFASVVHHPGTKAKPYLVPAAKWALNKVGIEKIVERWNRAA